MNPKIKQIVSLLEQYTGKKVILKENDEATKNLVVKNLTRLSEDLTSLNETIYSVVDSTKNLSDFTEKIDFLKVFGYDCSTVVDLISILILELQGNNDNALEEDLKMSSEEAVKNIDTVKKFIDKDVDITIDDENN